MDLAQLTINTPIHLINQFAKESLVGNLGIEFTHVKEGEVKAIMPLSSKTCRPGGMLHGGANLALAETLAGLGSMLMVDTSSVDIRGIQVNGNHTGAVTNGRVIATATIVHQGKQTHVWNVDIRDEEGRLVSTARVTNMIVRKDD